MTRLDFFKKWFAYGAVLVFLAILQGLVFTRFRLMGTIPMLLPLALTALAALEGAAAGAGFGTAVGVMSMYVDGSGAGVILGACLCGLIVGMLVRYLLRQNFVGYLMCSAGVLALRLVWCVLTRWLQGAAGLEILLRVGVPEFLWSLAFSPLVYLLFRFVCRRWGSVYFS